MATNCAIAVAHGDNFKVIYCHFDGYLDGVGNILHRYYNSPRANQLVSLGDLSILAKDIEPPIGAKHSFDNPIPDVCVFYVRDRGMEGLVYQTFCGVDSFSEYIQSYEFVYIMINDTWYVITDGRKFGDKKELSKVLNVNA